MNNHTNPIPLNILNEATQAADGFNRPHTIFTRGPLKWLVWPSEESVGLGWKRVLTVGPKGDHPRAYTWHIPPLTSDAEVVCVSLTPVEMALMGVA